MPAEDSAEQITEAAAAGGSAAFRGRTAEHRAEDAPQAAARVAPEHRTEDTAEVAAR